VADERRSVYEDRGVMTTHGWRLPWRKNFDEPEEPIRSRRLDDPRRAAIRTELRQLRRERDELNRRIGRMERELEET